MKILKYIAIILSLAQIAYLAYFLTDNSTDNLPLFIFLIVVPIINISALIFRKVEK